jgi:hypothetical protein
VKKIDAKDLELLQDLSKKYGLLWFIPTQKDAISALGRYIGKLFYHQRKFSPRSQKSLIEYHMAIEVANVMLDAGRNHKRAEDE